MFLLPTLFILPWVAQQDQERQWHQQQWWWCGGSKQQQAFGPLCQASIEKFLGNSSLSLIAVRPLPVEVQGLLLQLSELLNCTMGYILLSLVNVPFLKIPAFEKLFLNFIFLITYFLIKFKNIINLQRGLSKQYLILNSHSLFALVITYNAVVLHYVYSMHKKYR